MSKTIVVCCDGTNNQFGRVNTNVVRLFQSLDRAPSAAQAVYYDPGVGTLAAPGLATKTGKLISRVFGLAFGTGIIGNITDAVCFLMQQYEPGDKVCIFGFSRGAYTARAIAGLLHKCGLPEDGATNLLPYVLRMFRNTTDWSVNRDFKKTFGRHCPVHFLGLWDTVSTVGWIYNPQHFPYTRNNPGVTIVRHAVALDERRCFYRTNLWAMPDKALAADPIQLHQDAFEAWFPGVHSDVGGGYPLDQSSLWKLSFRWMVEEARKAGVKFDQKRLDAFLEGNSQGQSWSESGIHESLQGFWWFCEFLPKKYWDQRAQPPCYRFRIPAGKSREVPQGANLHRSIIDRMTVVSKYRPPNLNFNFVKTVLENPPTTEFVRYYA